LKEQEALQSKSEGFTELGEIKKRIEEQHEALQGPVGWRRCKKDYGRHRHARMLYGYSSITILEQLAELGLEYNRRYLLCI
jgi:hypothetical protein